MARSGAGSATRCPLHLVWGGAAVDAASAPAGVAPPPAGGGAPVCRPGAPALRSAGGGGGRCRTGLEASVCVCGWWPLVACPSDRHDALLSMLIQPFIAPAAPAARDRAAAVCGRGGRVVSLWLKRVPPRSPRRRLGKAATWLILPVVICLSQRLSHACLSINCFIL